MPSRELSRSKKTGSPFSTVPGSSVKPAVTPASPVLGSVTVTVEVPGVTSVSVCVPGSGAAVVHVTSAAAALPSSSCRCHVPLTKEYSTITDASDVESVVSTVTLSL